MFIVFNRQRKKLGPCVTYIVMHATQKQSQTTAIVHLAQTYRFDFFSHSHLWRVRQFLILTVLFHCIPDSNIGLKDF